MIRVLDPQSGEIDWPRLRARVAQSFESSHADLHSAGDHAKAILDERARRLATPAVEIGRQSPSIPVLPFRLGREQYGLETRFAREVTRLTDFTSIPGVPDFVIGVVNLRGEIVPLFDLMRFFGFASQGLTDRSQVIVVGAVAPEFGIIADTVQSVSAISPESFVPDPIFEGERGRECIRGITRDAMILLDGAALEHDQRLYVGSAENAAP